MSFLLSKAVLAQCDSEKKTLEEQPEQAAVDGGAGIGPNSFSRARPRLIKKPSMPAGALSCRAKEQSNDSTGVSASCDSESRERGCAHGRVVEKPGYRKADTSYSSKALSQGSAIETEMVNANKGTHASWLERQSPAQMPAFMLSPNRLDISLHVKFQNQDSAIETEIELGFKVVTSPLRPGLTQPKLLGIPRRKPDRLKLVSTSTAQDTGWLSAPSSSVVALEVRMKLSSNTRSSMVLPKLPEVKQEQLVV
ncbi:MAG: hypothetical protein FRX49_07704 [Trebouxia sp. A1-2]|nr:MAG: hypothetical protein FRX49_07704 [Trebouxia sp. A1-2]